MLKRVYVEISNICNLSCSFCPGTRREKRTMTADEFTVIAKRLRGHTQYLYFHLMGEPLLHPELEKLLEISCGMGFKVIITTNGTLLAERGNALISSPTVHKINISLQSFEANDGGELSDYVNQCAGFAASAAASGKICELRLWNKGGLESLNPLILRLLEAYFPRPWHESPRSVKLADRVFLAEDDRFDWPDLDAADRGERCFCYALRDQIGVLCDGTVVPCCLDHEGDVPLGNLFKNGLDYIMSTKRAEDIYNGFSQRKAIEELCRRCGYARRFT